MSPKELANKTIKDIEMRRKRIEEGKKQAFLHIVQNRERIRRRIK
ncbi:transcriptional regulator [Clostridium butyricum]|nr:transcriptional regulator [Clostridium butyricum]